MEMKRRPQMRILFGFFVGVASAHFLLAHIAIHVAQWHPLVVTLAMK
jgi:hypothetical protein